MLLQRHFSLHLQPRLRPRCRLRCRRRCLRRYLAQSRGRCIGRVCPLIPIQAAAVTAIGASTYGPVNTSGLGVFGIANVPAETYTVRATYPGYLTSEKTGIVVDGVASTFDAGTTRLLGGDATGDNVINILDVSLIISKFGQTGLPVLSASSTCTGTDEMSDINDDGIVNISDLAITAGNWNKVGPLPWLP
jgi:hypothetical protein